MGWELGFGGASSDEGDEIKWEKSWMGEGLGFYIKGENEWMTWIRTSVQKRLITPIQRRGMNQESEKWIKPKIWSDGHDQVRKSRDGIRDREIELRIQERDQRSRSHWNEMRSRLIFLASVEPTIGLTQANRTQVQIQVSDDPIKTIIKIIGVGI